MPRSDGKSFDFNFAGHAAVRGAVANANNNHIRSQARRWLVRNGHGDLLDILGLLEAK